MNVVCIEWNLDGERSHIIYPSLYIYIVAVIDQILQMIRIATLATLAQEQHRFAHEDSAFRLGLVLVD